MACKNKHNIFPPAAEFGFYIPLNLEADRADAHELLLGEGEAQAVTVVAVARPIAEAIG